MIGHRADGSTRAKPPSSTVRQFALCIWTAPWPSGDFWFLLVVSKGTRRRQGNWGDRQAMMNLVFAFCFWLTAESLNLALRKRRFGYICDTYPEDSQSRARYSVPLTLRAERAIPSRRPPICCRAGRAEVSVPPVRQFALCISTAPRLSGDFWFLLVASKGTRRRQGVMGRCGSP